MKQANYPAVYSPRPCIKVKGGKRPLYGMNATITFRKCVQGVTDSQLALASPTAPAEVESEKVARLYFSVRCDGRRHDDMLVEICEEENPAGSEVATRAIRISRPRGSFNMPWPYDAFTSAVESYYDKILKKRSLIPVELLSMFRGNVVTCTDSHEIEFPDEPPPPHHPKWQQRLGRWIGFSRDKS